MTLQLPISALAATAQPRPNARRTLLGLVKLLPASVAMACLLMAPLHAAEKGSAKGLAKAYVIGQLSGPLAAGLEIHLQDLDLPKPPPAEASQAAAVAIAVEIEAPVVLAGPTVNSLGDHDRAVIRQAFAEGWPIALVDASVDQINRVHEVAESSQVYQVPSMGRSPEAFAFVGKSDGGYSQWSAEALGGESFAEPLRAERALHLVDWLRSARAVGAQTSSAMTSSTQTTQDSTSSGSPELDQLVSAWTDTRVFYFASGSAQSTFQCVQEVWQAYQVSQQKDFYYLDQVCNFSPNNTYKVRGKKIEVPSVFGHEDWSAVGWSDTDKYCTTNSEAGDHYTACDYLNYATRYQMNLQPYSANGQSPIDPSLITLIQETPGTTSEDSTVTHGVTWSIGGQVVAGSSSASASVSAGVQVQNQTSTTIPAYTIQNNSFNGTQNAAWSYSMSPVDDIDDICTNTIEAPMDIQTNTFQTNQDMIWQVGSGYRSSDGFDGHFKVQLDVSAQLYESTMYVDKKGSIGVTNLSDCSIDGCSCDIVTNSNNPSLSPVILSIPVPSTDYTG